MIELLKKFKSPDQIDIASIRNYGDNTPSVTGLLSMIDSYEPNSEVLETAMERGTRIHKDIENIISNKQIITIQEPRFIKGFLPLAFFLSPKNKEETVFLETYIKIPGVFGGTIDYYKEVTKLGGRDTDIKDFKSCIKIPSFSSTLYNKYKIQLSAYRALLFAKYSKDKGLSNISTGLGFIIENNISQFYNTQTDFKESAEFNLLILYFHSINKTLYSNEILGYMYGNASLRDILEFYNELDFSNKELPKHIIDFLNECKVLFTTFKALPNKKDLYVSLTDTIEFKPSNVISYVEKTLTPLIDKNENNIDQISYNTINTNSPF